MATKQSSSASFPLVSIIMPVMNEAAILGPQLGRLAALPQTEVIVVDGGSHDATQAIVSLHSAAHPNVRLLQSARGRSIQMNAGAAVALGEWLLFLHADTILPPDSHQQLLRIAHTDPEHRAGAFAFQVTGNAGWFRWLERSVGWRNRRMRLPFGDQGLFVRRHYFRQLGGYREDYPLMEDLELVQRLRRASGFRILHDYPVITSGRRWEEEGYLFTSARNIFLQLLYSSGIHPRILAKMYWKK